MNLRKYKEKKHIKTYGRHYIWIGVDPIWIKRLPIEYHGISFYSSNTIEETSIDAIVLEEHIKIKDYPYYIDIIQDINTHKHYVVAMGRI
jgi:hypothetical protein